MMFMNQGNFGEETNFNPSRFIVSKPDETYNTKKPLQPLSRRQVRVLLDRRNTVQEICVSHMCPRFTDLSLELRRWSGRYTGTRFS